MKLRPAVANDCQLLFRWANDPNMRKYAVNSQKIKWDSHVSWFNEKIKSTSTLIFILEEANFNIGQVRYDFNKEENLWVIDYFIDKQFRGIGHGKKIIELSLNQVSGSKVAYVKLENIVSCKVFERLGFKRMKVEGEIVKYLYNNR